MRRLDLPKEKVSAKIVPPQNVVEAILAEAQNYDLVVLGCTGRPFFYQFARGSIPEDVALRCEKPLVMVKAMASGIRSFLRRG